MFVLSACLWSGCVIPLHGELASCERPSDCAGDEECFGGSCVPLGDPLVTIVPPARVSPEAPPYEWTARALVLPEAREVKVSAPRELVVREVEETPPPPPPPPPEFTTIADAIARAHPGDTIEIPAGVYAESIELTIPLTLRGPMVSLLAIRVSTRAVVLEDLLVEGSAGHGISVTSGGEATLRRVTVTAAAGSGVLAEDGAGIDVRDCEIYGNGTGNGLEGDGVLVQGSASTAVIEDNIIDDNEGYGVHCQDSADIASCAGNQHRNNGRGWTDCDGC